MIPARSWTECGPDGEPSVIWIDEEVGQDIQLAPDFTVGIDARTVANRLGHARTSTTLDIYWAWVPARDRDAADHLQAVLGPERH